MLMMERLIGWMREHPGTRFSTLGAAAEAFRAAAERHRSAPAWINLSSTLLELGDKAEALLAARTAQALAGDIWQAQADEALRQAQAASGSQ
jgi:hypothetical protein